MTAARRRAVKALRKPAAGVVIIAPLVLAGAVGASAPTLQHSVSNAAVTPLAAVAKAPQNPPGPSVVAVKKGPSAFRIAASTVSSPPPAVVVNSPGHMRIPAMALSAYRNAERMMAAAAPNCGVSWNLLAGIGRIESGHASGGATDSRGTAVNPIYGPALDGTLPGNEVIELSRNANRVTYARAMGPMQFLPGTWARYASDGDGDGKADVQNLYDSTLAAARYLCSGGLNLRDPSQVMSAILRYNNSVAYARNVLSWAGGYATGVVPVDLPPINGPVPALGASHTNGADGLGPGTPVNAMGLPADDPLALVPLLTRTDASRMPGTNVPGFAPGQRLGPLPGPAPEAPATTAPAPGAPAPWVPPWMAPPPAPQPSCVVFCLEDKPAPAAAPAPGPVLPAAPVPGPALPGPPAAPASGPAPGPVPAPAAPGPAAVPAAPLPGPAPTGPAPGPLA